MSPLCNAGIVHAICFMYLWCFLIVRFRVKHGPGVRPVTVKCRIRARLVAIIWIRFCIRLARGLVVARVKPASLRSPPKCIGSIHGPWAMSGGMVFVSVVYMRLPDVCVSGALIMCCAAVWRAAAWIRPVGPRRRLLITRAGTIDDAPGRGRRVRGSRMSSPPFVNKRMVVGGWPLARYYGPYGIGWASLKLTGWRFPWIGCRFF